MQIINDYFMVSIDHKYESDNKNGIITLNAAWVNDTTEDRFGYKRLYGQIESCPLKYTDTLAYLIDPGLPAPRLYISGDHIEAKIKMGFKDYGRHNYNPSTFEAYEVITMADIAKKVDIQRFDKVYFDPKVTEPENFLGMHKERELYKVRVDQILCVIRNSEIITQGGWCLVEPNMETWDDIKTKSGIIKKPNPEAKYLEGTMRYVTGRDDIKYGDDIRYLQYANWTAKIEGKDYYVIQGEDIICKVNKAA